MRIWEKPVYADLKENIKHEIELVLYEVFFNSGLFAILFFSYS